MANPGALVSKTAELLGMSEVYMGAFDRELAKHGLRTKHGRGPSAARMGSEDATNLLLAVLSGAQAKDSAESVARFSGLSARQQQQSMMVNNAMTTYFDYRRPFDSLALGLKRVDQLPVGHSFFDILNELIFCAQTGELQRATASRTASQSHDGLLSNGTWSISVRVIAQTTTAEVSLACDKAMMTCIYRNDEQKHDLGDLLRITRISHETLLGLGELLRE